MQHPLFNPHAGPQRIGEPPPRYPNRAETIAAIRVGVDAALACLKKDPDAPPERVANDAAFAALNARPAPTASGVVRQAEIVTLCNWLSGRVRRAIPGELPSLLANFDALCEGAPLPGE